MIKKFLVILFLDLIFLGFWVYEIHPDPSMSIVLIFILPVIVALNLFLSGLFFLYAKFIKKEKVKGYTRLFALNSVVAPVVFYFLFILVIEKGISDISSTYKFSVNDKKYNLVFQLSEGKFFEGGNFDILEEVDGGENGVMFGIYHEIGDSFLLTNDTSIHGGLPDLVQQPFFMTVFKKKLTGFPLHTSEINLKK